MFHQAKNVVISGGQFTIAANNHDAVSTILWPHVAAGAIFDSAERYAAGRCHPQTRRKVIDQMTTWIKDANPPQRILWMYGAAGSGKSALMQSLCELLRDLHTELKGGSFFFAKGHLIRGNADKLFVTLAYQLAIQFPAVRAAINDALAQDPSLPTKSMDIQLQSLIIGPLLVLRSQESPSKTTPTLLIDGLDECDSNRAKRTQCQIITLVSKSIIEHDIAIRFIIASRPEYWIRDTFKTSPLPDITYSLSLRDDVEADKDIKAYLTDGFEKIRQDNIRIMHSVDLPWPPEYIVDRFVYEASGQYIYASIILKFVGNDALFDDPQEQLKIIVTSGSDGAPAFTELDRLYQTVLSVYPRWEQMKRVLAGLLMNVNLTVIRVLLGVPQTEITLVLDALSSLIDITPPEPLSEYDQLLSPIFGSSLEDEDISFCHLSFREFLRDKARSGSYHVDVPAIKTEAINAFFAVIQRNLDKNYEIEPHVSLDITILEYRRMMEALVRLGASCDDWYDGILDSLPALINSMMERFRRFDPGRHMNYPACFIRDVQSLSGFLCDVDGEAYHSLSMYLFPTTNKLQKMALMAYKIGMHQLTLNIPWHRSSGVTIQDLLKVPGSTVADILSTIRQHRHIIELRHNKPNNKSDLAFPGSTEADILSTIIRQHRHIIELRHNKPNNKSDLASLSREDQPSMFLRKLRVDHHQIPEPFPGRSYDGELTATIDEGWLSRREWTNQHVSLICEFLKSVKMDHDNVWEHFELRFDDYWTVTVKNAILENFFDNGDLSDIRGEGYFENKYHISLLEVMADSEVWMVLFPLRPKMWTDLDSLINPILSWFDRQLTNPAAIRLMEEHDVFLPQKLTTAMKCIFQHCFIPIFNTPYFSDLLISTFPEENESIERKTIRIKVLQSNLLEEETVFIPSEDHFYFTVPEFLKRQHPPPPIPTSEWYPCFSSYILNIMVKDLYRRSHPEFGNQMIERSPLFRRFDTDSFSLTSFEYIFKGFQYAPATPQNLDALRAIKYLYCQMVVMDYNVLGFGMSWPQRFSPVRDFLKRYKPSVLQPDELSDFESWLRDIDEYYGRTLLCKGEPHPESQR